MKLGVLLILFFVISVSNNVYAEDEFYCGTNPASPGNKILYKAELNNIDTKLEDYMAINKISEVNDSNIAELNDHMVGSYLNEAGQMGECLVRGGVKDLESVAALSDDTKQVLMYNIPKLTEEAPDFVKTVPIPEFGPLAGMMIAVSMVTILTIHRKFYLKS